MKSRRTVFAALSLGMVVAPAVLLMAQSGAATAQTAAPTAFARCNTCHGPNALPANKGPDLKGVFNRAIASESGYAYSDALKAKSSQRWTEANLNAFLTKPGDFANGTKMRTGVSDAAQRAEVIAYLKTLK